MPGLPPGPHLDLLLEALDLEARAQRLLLDGDVDGASSGFRLAATRYRESYDCAPPASHGRLIGQMKALVIGGDMDMARAAAASASDLLIGSEPTPPAAYATALAALIGGRDAEALGQTPAMRPGGDAFVRAADAIDAIAGRDEPGARQALDAIVADFETREQHLTGVPIADTAIMLARLASDRGIHLTLRSPVLPST